MRNSHNYKLRRTKKISYKHQIVQLATRNILTKPFISISYISSITIVLVTILLLTSTASILTNLYTKETFGLSFDYILDENIEYQLFDQINHKYIENYAFINDGSAYLVDDDSTREKSKLQYYPGVVINITGKMSHFLSLKDGAYPPEVSAEEGGEYLYQKQKALIPFRLKNDFGLYVQNDNLDSTHILKSYIGLSAGTGYTRSIPISGVTESIINDGYIIFTNQKLPLVDQGHYPKLPTMIINLKKTANAKDFQVSLKKNNIKYVSYDNVLNQMQKKRNKLNSKLVFIMTIVMFLSFLTFIITLYANIRVELENKRYENNLLMKFGFSKRKLIKRDIVQQILLFCGAILSSFIIYFIFQFLYFSVLKVYLGLNSLPYHVNYALIIYILLFLIGIIILYFISKKRLGSPE